MYSIYKLTAPDGRVYIGQTKHKPKYRFNNGNGYLWHSSPNSSIANAIREYGLESFTNEVLTTTESLDEANRLERFYIDLYDSTNELKGLNIQKGGRIGNCKFQVLYSDSYKSKLKGRHFSPSTEFKKGMKPTRISPVICLNNGKRYESCKEASKELGIPFNHISCCCLGVRKSTYGYKFKYADK